MSEKDTDIIHRICEGDRRAYAELIERHKDRAMTLAMRMMKNRADAEEALQDAFVRAFHALPAFENKSTFSTWFYRIVFNVCSTQLSKRPKQHAVSYQEETDNGMTGTTEPVSAEMPDLDYESAEFHAIVQEEIGAMSERYASILTLFFVQEMGYEEIVDVTGLPLGTVKNRLFRARTLLQRAVLNRLGEKEYAGHQMENRQ